MLPDGAGTVEEVVSLVTTGVSLTTFLDEFTADTGALPASAPVVEVAAAAVVAVVVVVVVGSKAAALVSCE